jgi:hypothetical protein
MTVKYTLALIMYHFEFEMATEEDKKTVPLYGMGMEGSPACPIKKKNRREF